MLFPLGFNSRTLCPQVSSDRDFGDDNKRVHRLGETGATPGHHQGRNVGGLDGRRVRCSHPADSRLSFECQTKFLFVRVRVPDKSWRLSTGACAALGSIIYYRRLLYFPDARCHSQCSIECRRCKLVLNSALVRMQREWSHYLVGGHLVSEGPRYSELVYAEMVSSGEEKIRRARDRILEQGSMRRRRRKRCCLAWRLNGRAVRVFSSRGNVAFIEETCVTINPEKY